MDLGDVFAYGVVQLTPMMNDAIESKYALNPHVTHVNGSPNFNAVF